MEQITKLAEIQQTVFTRLDTLTAANKQKDVIQVNQPNPQSTSTPYRLIRNPQAENLTRITNSDQAQNNLNIQELNLTMQEIRQEIRTNHNLDTQKVYILSNKANLNLWLDFLYSELESRNLLDVIDSRLE